MSVSPFLPHPTIKAPTMEQVAAMVRAHGRERAAEICQEIEVKRLEAMRQEKEDPFRFGFVPEHWRKAEALLDAHRELLILGGNRAAKSRFAAWKLMKAMVAKPDSRWWCFHQNNTQSIAWQQPTVFDYIPKEWKTVKKDRYTNVNFTQKNGFSDSTFILPNRAQCWFFTYEMEKTIIEGGEIDGFWCDELVPMDWLETLMFRIITRKGCGLTTFTPVDGYTPTVGMYLEGAVTEEEEDADLLPVYGRDGLTRTDTDNGPHGQDGERRIVGYKKVPRVQRSVARPRARIMYFYSRDNPYNPYEEVVSALQGQPEEKVLERAYGVPHNSKQSQFPAFVDRVHVVKELKVPVRGTRFHFVDPCGGNRNWFMLWVIVDPFGRHFVYREWPSPKIYVPGEGWPGNWAEPDAKKKDGRRGPAQSGFGWGLPKYKEEILRLEAREYVKTPEEVADELKELTTLFRAGRITARQAADRREAVTAQVAREEMEERYMDRRYGNAKGSIAGKEDAVTMIEECEEIGLDFRETPPDDIDTGVKRINNLLAFDKEKPLGFGNEPKLYICENCVNTLFAIKTWTGEDGRHGATKDPVDLLRYIVLSRLEYSDPAGEQGHKGGSY